MVGPDTSRESKEKLLNGVLKSAKRYWSLVISAGGLVAYLGNPSWFDANNKWIVAIAGFLLFIFGAFYGMQSAIESEDRKAENERREKVALLEAQAAIDDRRASERDRTEKDEEAAKYEREVLNHARRIPTYLRDTLLRCIEDGPQKVDMKRADYCEPNRHFRSLTIGTVLNGNFEKREVSQSVANVLRSHPDLFDDVYEMRRRRHASEIASSAKKAAVGAVNKLPVGEPGTESLESPETR